MDILNIAGRFRIYLIEDNDDHAELFERCVIESDANVTVQRVIDGFDAINELFPENKSRSANLPDLIVLDLKLPKINGIEVLKKLKSEESTKHIPVVIFTSSEALLDINSAYKNYANSYFVKPITYDDYYKTVLVLKNYWEKYNITKKE